MKKIYVATYPPYGGDVSGEYYKELARNAEAACSLLQKAGYAVCCPFMCTVGPTPTLAYRDDLLASNLELVAQCDGLYALPAQRLTDSCCERSFAQALGIPIFRDLRSLTSGTMVIGLPRSGKTTFLYESCSPYNDCSTIIKEALDHYSMASRALKVYVGNKLCEQHPDRLALTCLQRGPVVGGVRRRIEYDTVRGWFKRVVWINRPGGPVVADNTEVTEKDADLSITNDGTAEFKLTARTYLEEWGLT